MVGYEDDTVLPTLVVTDAEGRVVFADETDNYRVRPIPDTVIGALRDAGVATRPASTSGPQKEQGEVPL
jgi:hypothetical protein